MGHVFTRVSGYGVRLLPEPGTSLSAIETPTAVRIRTDGEPESTISIDSARRALGNQASIFEAGIELTAGPDASRVAARDQRVHVRLAAAISSSWFLTRHPILLSTSSDRARCRFGSTALCPETGLRLRRSFDLRDKSVRKTGRTGDAEWIDVSYEHDGESWMQRYHFVPWTSRDVLVAVVQSLDREAPPDFVAKFIASIRETRDAEHGF